MAFVPLKFRAPIGDVQEHRVHERVRCRHLEPHHGLEQDGNSFTLARLRDGFLVDDAGPRRRKVDAELLSQSVDDDLELELADSANNDLIRLVLTRPVPTERNRGRRRLAV